MASFNQLTRELVLKIVFYGPGLGGKTTTLQYIYASTKQEHRGKMVSLATPTDRTLYFDFLPIRVPKVRGLNVRLQLFTVPGQVYFEATRKLVLTGADGIVFVADSQSGRLEANRESLEDLNANLKEHGRLLSSVPHTFHWNKRDLSDLVPLEELERRFNLHGAPSLGTVATRGDGVFEGLERITNLVIRAYESEVRGAERSERTPDLSRSDDSIAEAIRGLTEAAPVIRHTPSAGIPRISPEALRSAPPAAPIPALQNLPEPHALDVAPEPRPLDPRAIDVTRPPEMPPTDVTKPPERPPSHLRHDAAPAPVHTATVKPPVIPPIGPADLPEPRPETPTHLNLSPDTPSKRAAALAGAVVNGDPRRSKPPVEPVAPVQSQPVVESRGVNGVEPHAPPNTVFSFAELWPEPDRPQIRQMEALLSQGDTAAAILQCEVLLTRIFASTSALAGATEAPRDPGVVALLLGLEGTRYLRFRALVRAARHKEEISSRSALECYSFVLEARRARAKLA